MPTTTPFNNLITFSRGSNATLTGSNGLIQWAPANLLLQSESFDAVVWDKANVAIYPNQDIPGGTLGAELVTNGDFSSASGWTLPATGTNSITGGQAVLSGAAGYLLRTGTNITTGRWYRVSFTVTGYSGSGTVRPYIQASPVFGSNVTGNGTFVQYLLATATNANTEIGLNFASSFTGNIDDISIKEVTPAAATAPDGTQTADTMLTNGVAAIQRVGLSGAPSSTTTGLTTYSVYVKAGTAQFVQILHGSDANAFANFNVASGTLGTRGTGASSTITAVGNGWYRCTFTFNIASGAVWYIYIVPSASAAYGASFTATVANVLIWGAQLELGSTATTYNPTTVKNLLGFSEAFDNAAWTKSRASIVTGAQANPINGLFNAQKLMENTENNYHYLVRGSLGVTAGTYTLSIYAKAAERSRILLYFGPTNKGRAFDLAAGTTYQQSGVPDPDAYSIVSLGGGWYRCSITVNSATPTTAEIYLVSGAAFSYTGDGNSGVYIYGAQLSDSASLDPYVPTPGAAPSSTAFYGPRFDFDPVTLQPRGLLVEEQRTNLLLYSERFDIGGGSWPLANVSVTPNSTTAPDGTLTADTITVTSTGSFRYINQVLTLTNGVTYTLTVYLKYKTARYIWLLGETSTDAFAIFDLVTGTVGSVSAGVTRSITPVGNGWYRCSATFTVSSATAPQQVGFGFSDTDTVIVPVATAGIDTFAWGAQLEAGAFATSYIPTVASTVTRSADVATISGSLFSQWYGQSEGSFVASVGLLASFNFPVPFMAADSAAATTKRIQIYLSGTAPTYRVTDGTDQVAINTAAVAIPGTSNFATAYQANNFAATVNGAAVATDSSGTVPAVNTFYIGNQASTQFINGHIRSINFIPARAADFQLQALTAQSIVDYFYLQTAAGDQLIAGNDDYLYSLPILG